MNELPVWFDTQQSETESRVVEHRGIGLVLPARMSDCTGRYPSWRPFQVNVCDVDAADPIPLTARERSVF